MLLLSRLLSAFHKKGQVLEIWTTSVSELVGNSQSTKLYGSPTSDLIASEAFLLCRLRKHRMCREDVLSPADTCDIKVIWATKAFCSWALDPKVSKSRWDEVAVSVREALRRSECNKWDELVALLREGLNLSADGSGDIYH